MSDVTIDGTRYVPATEVPSARIGIAITTHDRQKVLDKALAAQMEHLPAGALLVVVDDGSNPQATVPEGVRLVRIDKSVGIPQAKNRCLIELLHAGCEHLFLFDDDAYPIADGWERPYIESPEPHLSYQFVDLAGPHKLHDVCVLAEGDGHVAYSGQRGVMLYYERCVIETVGGFDPIYGRGMYEHSDLAMRVHRAGFTTFAFMDVKGSEKLIHSMDEYEEVERSVPQPQRHAQVATNAKIHNTRRDNLSWPSYVPLAKGDNAVITCLLTSQSDPQRGRKWAADPATLSEWAQSIRGARKVVIADELTQPPDGCELVRVEPMQLNLYFRRWAEVYRFLRAHDEIGRVFVTDGSDVKMLREPWDEMRDGLVYVGSEPKTYADRWAIDKHPGKRYQEWLSKYAALPMVNAGLLGGSREDVMLFAQRVLAVGEMEICRRFWRKETKAEVGDMVAFGMVAYSDEFRDRLVFGPQVHTVFRQEEANNQWAWWKHR